MPKPIENAKENTVYITENTVEIVQPQRKGTYRCTLGQCPFGMGDLCCFSCDSLEICREACNEIKTGDVDTPETCCNCEIQQTL